MSWVLATVQGPLAVLQDNLKQEQLPKILIEYVNCFRYRLYRAQKLAKKNSGVIPDKNENTMIDRLKDAHFCQGIRLVLVLLSVICSPFQARYSGPHTVMEKLSDQNYTIATPQPRTGKQLCHVNLLKPYLFCAEDSRGQEAGTPVHQVLHV